MDGAQEKTRTSTTFLPQVPETCASTNSATWASRRTPARRDKPGLRRCQPPRRKTTKQWVEPAVMAGA